MSARSSATMPVLLLALLLLIPADDGVKRAYLPALYLQDVKAAIAHLQLEKAFAALGIKIDEQADTSILAQKDNDLSSGEKTQNHDNNDSNDDNNSNESIDVDNDDNASAIANKVFNDARSRCGLDTLSPDAELKQVALGHANYIKYIFAHSQPALFYPHYQNEIKDIKAVTSSNNPHYSGLDIKNRLFNASYANLKYGFTENIAQSMYYHSAGELLSAETITTSMARSLLAAPYHLRSLMQPSSKVVGTAVVAYKPYNKDTRNNQGYVLVSNAAATADTVDANYAGVLTYPCQGVTGTVTALYNETPDPVKHTGRDLSTDPIGQPIYIKVAAADTIQIINIRFYDELRRTAIPTQVLDYQSDPYLNTDYELPKNEAFILPITDAVDSCKASIKQTMIKKANNCGLQGSTEYKVSFDVIINDQRLISKSFSFMTGEVNYS